MTLDMLMSMRRRWWLRKAPIALRALPRQVGEELVAATSLDVIVGGLSTSPSPTCWGSARRAMEASKQNPGSSPGLFLCAGFETQYRPVVPVAGAAAPPVVDGNGLPLRSGRGFGFGIGSTPSRCSFLRSALRARRMASACSRTRFSDGFSKASFMRSSRNRPSRCIFFFMKRRACSTLLSRTRIRMKSFSAVADLKRGEFVPEKIPRHFTIRFCPPPVHPWLAGLETKIRLRQPEGCRQKTCPCACQRSGRS